MRYVGGKTRLIKNYRHLIEENLESSSAYLEPFLGGGNSFSEIRHHNKQGSDLDKYSVSLLKAVSSGWDIPEKVTQKEYESVKKNYNLYPDYYVGFVGYCCSFGGKFFGGYAAGLNSKGENRNYALESKNRLLKQKPGLLNSKLRVMDYTSCDYTKDSVVYMDPPYANTQGYKVTNFDIDYFWGFVNEVKKDVKKLFVSEFECPLKCSEVIWSKERACSLDKNTGGKRKTEKLFLIE